MDENDERRAPRRTDDGMARTVASSSVARAIAEERETIDRLSSKGFGVVTPDQFRIDIPPEFLSLWEEVCGFTMTSLERGFALHQATRYLCDAAVAGDVVECGVWRGGSCMLVAKTLLAAARGANGSRPGSSRGAGPRGGGSEVAAARERSIWLYDTFAGPTRPTDRDRIAWNGKGVVERWEADRRGEARNFTGWAVGRDEVAANMRAAGWPPEATHLVAGDVLETLEAHLPERIALLRLDTDWYESTARELEVLYPRLVQGGVLIIDDYGHFEGARRAVDDYFAPATGRHILLNRIDYTGRIGVKL